jgi:hypothetical protein
LKTPQIRRFNLHICLRQTGLRLKVKGIFFILQVLNGFDNNEKAKCFKKASNCLKAGNLLSPQVAGTF